MRLRESTIRTLAIWGTLAALALVAASSQAEELVRWQGDIDRARQLAAQSNRLVLIHFVSRGCEPCARLEANVFSQPTFAQTLDADFVPVKINASDFPITAQRYGVATAPSDVVITPGGQLVCKTSCPQDAAQYVSQLRRISDNYRRVSTELAGAGLAGPHAVGHPVQPPAASVTADPRVQAFMANPAAAPNIAQPAPPAANTPAIQPSATPGAPITIPSQAAPSVAQPAPPAWTPNRPQAGPSTEIAAGTTPAGALGPAQPTMALDGYCPVQLIEGQRWTPGDRRFGAVHRGRLYFFAGPNDQQRFMRDPDRYSPMLAGFDPVVWQESGQLVPGRREHGVFHDNRVFLFATEDSIARFERNPGIYTQQIEQAMRNPGAIRR
jgi:hypothetical protein